METRPILQARLSSILAGATVFALLYFAHLSSYLLFHSLAEFFTIVVAACIFMVIWNSRHLIENQYLLFLGVASLAVASVDLLHILTFPGMGILPGVPADTPARLWILGRAMQAAAFVLAPTMFDRQVNAKMWLAAWTGVATAMVGVIFMTDALPTYHQSTGFAAFDITASLAVSAVLVLALVRLRRHLDRFQPMVAQALSWSIGVTIMSELAFILYVDPHGPFNLIGHFARIVATYLLYKTIIETALTEPHKVLFRELNEANLALRESESLTQRAMTLSEAMNGIDAAINSTLELDQILPRALLGAAHALNADSAAITFRTGDGWVIRHVYGLPADLVGSVLHEPQAHHLTMAAELRMPIVIPDADNDERVDSDLMKHYGIRSLMTVPLASANDVIGIITFHMESDTKAFDEPGRGFAVRLAVALALAVENARLYDTQHEIAETLQRAMLYFPEQLPGVDLGHAYRSADELALSGGDFYAAFELGDGRVGLVLGDVSGKGIAAATASSVVRTTLHAFSLRDSRPANVLAAANKVLVQLLPEGAFATATYATVDVMTGRVVLCSAGHPDPFVCTPTGCLRHDARRNRPLGLWEDTTFEEFSVTLRPGDTIVLFSDGLPDARCGTEFLGEERVAEVLDRMRDADPQFIVDALMARAVEFAGDQHTDDIAIIAATIRPRES